MTDRPGSPEPGDAPGLPPDDAERESAYALLQRGQALIKSRHHAQAAVVLERASRLEPAKGSILEPLGRAYHHSGQFERARETFEALLDVDPSAHWAHFALAASLRKLGRLPEARTHLRLAVALSPGSELYRRALAKLVATAPAEPTTDTAAAAPPGPGDARDAPGAASEDRGIAPHEPGSDSSESDAA